MAQEAINAAVAVLASSTPAMGANPCVNQHGVLAFASYRDGESEIYSMNSNGTALTQLTHGEERVSKPAWSPVGNSIAYVATLNNTDLEIYTMKADGSSQTWLTESFRVDSEPS